MRLIWALFQPSNSLALVALAGAALLLAGRRRAGTWLTAIAAGLFAAIMLLPLPGALMLPLETRFPLPALPAHVDGIITLGGSLNSRKTDRWGRPQLNEHAERLTEAAVLARRYPDATLLISGGHWDPDDRLAEADVAARFYRELGVPTNRVLIENRSRTTWENGVFSRDLARPRSGQTWILVTSSYHLPRAVGVFRELGWDVIPYPTDYQTDGRVGWGRIDSVGERLEAVDFALREWLALAAYRLQGRTSELFPK
jgi:uncharacterized SAM-binding protein YcdF (DUF218 family)